MNATENLRLPKHISAHPDGLLVRVTRGGVLYQAFVRRGHPDGLARALELRDRFLRLAGGTIRTKGHSNTGIVGISETTQWSRGVGLPCFEAGASRGGRTCMKRFIYGPVRPRAEALRLAVAWRAANAGKAVACA